MGKGREWGMGMEGALVPFPIPFPIPLGEGDGEGDGDRAL